MTAPAKVVVYVKPACTLCEPLLRIVEKVRADVGFELEKVDIETDPELMARYGHEIPVVTIDGRKAFKGHLTEPALRKKLRKAREQAALRGEQGEDDDELGDVQEEPAIIHDAKPFVPPRALAAAFLAVTLALAGWFVARGIAEANEGRGRLAGQLLRVEPRDQQPIRFELETMAGKKLGLDDFRDKVVFLNFWATWCPPCVEEMPSMLRMSERMRNDPRFVVLAVSADEGWPAVKQFWAGKPQPPFEVLLDQGGKIAKQYGTTMFPETYVVKNGRVVAFIEGPRDWDKWYADEFLRSISSSL